MRQEKRDEPKRQCEIIDYIMNSDRYDDAARVYFIQSYLLGWISGEKIIDPFGIGKEDE